ncbi:MAG: hypothetical protein RKP20_17685 [Candidatus Competibacter sp.]|nr:hypothetical protein [Candidatus Competibacter sp.]
MTADRRTLEQLRAQARQARETGDYSQAARLERQAVDRAEFLGLAGERTRALLWEGYSLRQAGEDDLALAALLQAANERSGAADPADVFGALTTIVHISLDRKPLRFCRALLDQARDYLADIRRPWAAPLDFLEGELAYRRGEFAAAWDWHSRAWVGWRDEHPRLTPATHLWALCRAAFRRRDPVDLTRLVERLAALHPSPVLERQMAQRAGLLLWRARRDSDRPDADSTIESALTLLAATASGRRDAFGARHEALRVLALAGRWEEVDEALARHPLESVGSFENTLLLGDLALNRARAALGLPAADDDYDEPMTDTANPGIASRSSPAAIDELREAGRRYRAARQSADARDDQLETGWHASTVERRQHLLDAVIRESESPEMHQEAGTATATAARGRPDVSPPTG